MRDILKIVGKKEKNMSSREHYRLIVPLQTAYLSTAFHLRSSNSHVFNSVLLDFSYMEMSMFLTNIRTFFIFKQIPLSDTMNI